MSNVRVKICGITSLEDALAAVDAGADALGFVFHRASPRFVTAAQAFAITSSLPAFVAKVGLFVDAGEAFVHETAGICGLDTLQFHGEESPEFCRRFALKVIKAFRIRDEGSLAALKAYGRETCLLDSYVPDKLGGTGERFNWALAANASQFAPRIILAGGLTSANVADAVKQVRPYAVDVSSGVESSPGRKDPAKVMAFVRAAKWAANSHNSLP